MRVSAFFQRVKIVKFVHISKQHIMRRSVFIALLVLGLVFSVNVSRGDNVAHGVRVIVIDAGHGGSSFPGARYGGYSEKNINLQVALKLGALIENNLPGVKVVYTRRTDQQFSSSWRSDLQARADIANSADGDLFISIHSNAARNTSVRGVETLIMGESSMEKRVNDEVLFANNKDEFFDMSDQKDAAIVRAYIANLRFTYGEYSEVMANLVQKHYAKTGRVNRGVRKQPLRVLYATNMPGILTEIGFMSNAQELKYITSQKGQNEVAGAIFGAVKDYVEYVRKSMLVESSQAGTSSAIDDKGSDAPSETGDETSASLSGVKYAIQIMASAKRLPAGHSEFRSYRNKVTEYRTGGRFPYKYCVGSYDSKASAQQSLGSVRREFPSAFVVAVENGALTTAK